MRISDCSSDVCASDLKTHVRESGTVRRVTAAILVDGKMVTDPAGNATYEPRSPEEMEKLATLARSAIGYDEARGDKVAIVNMQFARPDDPGPADNALPGPPGDRTSGREGKQVSERGRLGGRPNL